jgi:hypothetical protein
MAGNTGNLIDLDEVNVDDPRRRLSQLSHIQVAKEYKKGFKLLQKAGLRPEDSLDPPLRVAVRNPREGLKDDDLNGRKTLGEPRAGRGSKDTIGVEKPLTTNIETSIDDLRKILPEVRSYLDRRGGSCSITDVLKTMVRPRLGPITQRSFLIAARVIGLSSFGFNITETDDALILARPVDSGDHTLKPCLCGATFKDTWSWANHVLRETVESHRGYLQRLGNIVNCVRCLVCRANTDPFENVHDLVEHCMQYKSESNHSEFGCTLLITFLDSDEDPLGDNVRSLLLSALESGDVDFPWRSLSGAARDPFLDIPFPEGPPTPIFLDDDNDDDHDVVEVVSIDSEFINLED